MERRKLGREGLEVSCIGLGCMSMTGTYGSSPDEQEALRTLRRSLEVGIDFLDTAEVYGPYKNEELLSRFLKDHRDKVVIATKFGFNIENGKMIGVNGHPKNVKVAVEGSLKRLGIDVIDLYYQHRVDPKVPIEETVGAMGELVSAGKVRYLGLSEAGPETLKRAHQTHKISALQSEYSLWERGVEEKILPRLRELSIGFVPFSPVGRGFLTGQIKSFDDLGQDDFRRTDPRYQGENFQKNLKLVEVVKEIAARHNATPAQIALAWTLHQGSDIVPIPGTKRVKYLEENAAAWKVKLGKDDLGELNSLAEKTSGERYNAENMARVER
jgi:aryl-alcohol dehydrogenase-like predicted oxidoreductase